MLPSVTDFQAVIRSPPETVDDAHDFLQSVWLDRPDVGVEDRMAVETVLSELVTNIIQNNPYRQVLCEVTLRIGSDVLQLEAADTGDRLEAMPTSDGMPDDTAEHGRGMALIQMIADSLTYRHDGSRNVWQVERSRRHGTSDPG